MTMDASSHPGLPGWMSRVPSPFPAVIDHLPPDGRSLHHNQRRTASVVVVETANMMSYPVKQQQVVPTMRAMDSSAGITSTRRVPPPPPPRSAAVVAAAAASRPIPAPKPVVAKVVVQSDPTRINKSSHNSKENHLPTAPSSSAGNSYLETRYAYSVNGILGSAAQASAAAAFFARASQKLNLASPHRRKRHGSSSDGTESPVNGSPSHRSHHHHRHHFATDFSGLLRRNPPTPPARLLHRLGTREKCGVGKVRVMLRVSGDPSASSFLSVDKKRKQLTLQEPPATSLHQQHEDRRVGVAAPKMFAFDGLFTPEDTQADVASSVLSDIVTAVINGSDGCVFCYGHAQLGKTSTMVGTCAADGTGAGLMPTAIAWLYRGIAEQKSKTGARFSVRVSAVEVAGPAETLRDLLAPHATESEESPGVYLRDDPLLGTQLQNQSELRAPTAEKAAFYLDAALAARTDSSSPDSRFSHLLYTLHVYQYSVDRTPGRSTNSSQNGSAGVAGGRSRLHLLDLGSCQTIRSAAAASSSGQATSSAMTLSGLGNVLVALFNGQRHLPHREHKITQVLRECLGSLTCQAALVAHVAAASAYSETLSTVQMASRVHRMRRRRVKPYNNGGSGGSGSGGSSEESVRMGLRSSSGGETSGSTSAGSADPSSSEQSCDTVIYVGPIDDATDGEHPPVYLPSLNSGDQRCSMSRALRGSSVDHGRAGQPSKIPNGIQQMKKVVEQQPPRSPQVQRKVPSKCEVVQQPPSSGEEQWIDGPRFNKSRISQARMQVMARQQPQQQQMEMWVDGPASNSNPVAPTVAPTNGPTLNPAPTAPTATPPTAAQGYGFMDHHKQGMIRQWVETQSAQQFRLSGSSVRTNGQVWIDAQPRPAPEPGTPVKVLTVFKTCPDEDEDEETHQQEDVRRRSPLTKPTTVIESNASSVQPAENNAAAGHVTAAKASSSPRMSRPKYIPISKPSEPAAEVNQQPPCLPVTKSLTTAEENKQLNALSDPKATVSTTTTTTTASSTALTLEQLYSQCEQLAESLCRQEIDYDQGSTECESTEDDMSAALDVTSEQVSVSCDSWRRVSRHHQTIQEESDEASSSGKNSATPGLHVRQPMNGRGGDYSPEYIEVEEPDSPVPMQDSCLQVTEEDIALSMMQADAVGGRQEHPLSALSTDNLTVISHFTGETYSQGTASDWEPIDDGCGELGNIFDPANGGLHSDFYQTQLEQLAKLHQQIYQSQEPAGCGEEELQPTPLSALTASAIGSFKDLPLLSQDWANPPASGRAAGNGVKEARKALVSTIGLELERELGIQDAAANHHNPHYNMLSSLRHPDGASDPHLDQHEDIHPCERLPGNGAPDCGAQDITEKPVAPTPPAAAVVVVETPKPAKTPKLSRFFSKNKSSSSKRTTATSTTTSGNSPILAPKSAKGSPKVEKRSSKSAKQSPAKSSSKSPSRQLMEAPLAAASSSVPPSPKSTKSGSGGTKKDGNNKMTSRTSGKSPKRDPSKTNWPELKTSSSTSKRDVKSYGFSYESCHHHHQQTAPSSLCPSEGYESGSDSGVHLTAASPVKMGRGQRPVLMPSIGELSRCGKAPTMMTFSSSGTSTSGSGGSNGGHHYESSGYESVMRDSECSSLGSSSQDSDRGSGGGCITGVTSAADHQMAVTVLPPSKPNAQIGQSSSCTIL